MRVLKKMLIYLSGPMTGYENDNIPMFEDVARKVRRWPLDEIKDIVVPHEVTKDMPRDSNWKEFVKADIKAMLDCDAILLLKGWGESKGARLELHIALELGMKVYFWNEFEDNMICMNRNK
jgi:hypothetical protein